MEQTHYAIAISTQSLLQIKVKVTFACSIIKSIVICHCGDGFQVSLPSVCLGFTINTIGLLVFHYQNRSEVNNSGKTDCEETIYLFTYDKLTKVEHLLYVGSFILNK